MATDVLLAKAATIERTLRRVAEEYEGHEAELEHNYTRQDAILLNLQRSCQACIDGAMHLVRVHGLGLPQESREAFTLLEEAGLLGPELAARLRAMVGFRNVAIHAYTHLDLAIVRSILEQELDGLRAFGKLLVAQGVPGGGGRG